MKKVLTIAGFDGSGGAGLQADLKTFSALGCYGMTVITALTIQNTQGVKACYEIPLKGLLEQLEAIFEDLPPDAIKIGMLYRTSIIERVSKFLSEKARSIPIVLDPVMVAKSGDWLLEQHAVEALKEQMLPLATLITPNLPEAEKLTGLEILSPKTIKMAADSFIKLGAKAVLIKGGHATNEAYASDFLLTQKCEEKWFRTKRIKTNNHHGTGCTLSSAIAANLAHNQSIVTACLGAKNYLTGALEAAKNLTIGKGIGPVHHFYKWW